MFAFQLFTVCYSCIVFFLHASRVLRHLNLYIEQYGYYICIQYTLYDVNIICIGVFMKANHLTKLLFPI